MVKLLFLFLLRLWLPSLLLVSSAPVFSQGQVLQSDKHAFRVVTLVRGLENPWSLAFLPDGRMLITERAGRLRLVSKDLKLDPQAVEGLPQIAARGQGGLFDVVLHPNYAQNGWIYWAYNAPGPGGWGTAMARGKLMGHRMTQVQVLFDMQPKTRSGQHFGGRIVFNASGLVYLTLGDRGDMARAQLPGDHAGSVIRLHDDGRVPPDNPFMGQAGARAEKWSLGHRNIQGAALHPQTGHLWTHEHGPQGGDEVNVVRAGRNYGWPVITHGVNYGSGSSIGDGPAKPGLEQPIHLWTPSIAPSGMTFVSGNSFPRWRGDLLAGALRGQMLVRLELAGDKVVREERLLVDQVGRIRDVRLGPEGFIYVLTDEPQGALLRLEGVGP